MFDHPGTLLVALALPGSSVTTSTAVASVTMMVATEFTPSSVIVSTLTFHWDRTCGALSCGTRGPGHERATGLSRN